MRRVVVTGMGVISPIGTNVKDSWQNIIIGKCGISKLGDKIFENLPSKVAGVIKENGVKFELGNYFKKSELRSMGPATGYALLAAKEALQDAKLENITEEEKLRTGVAVGMGMADFYDICETNNAFTKSYNQVSPFFVPRILLNMPAGQISIKYGFQGPNHAVSTACATGVHAIGDSFRFICNGDADIMICGGTEASVSPLSIAAFCRLRALSTGFNDNPQFASRPFDKRRDGFVISEGSAILVLEELEHALNRGAFIYAEILGYGLSGDASHLTAPNRHGVGAILAMKRALMNARVVSTDITYVNAHATSTPLGDAIEIKAIKSVFMDHCSKLAISSTKGAHGHLLGAAGNLETVFVIKALQEKLIPPTINIEEVEDDSLNYVPNEPQVWGIKGVRIALKNSFGFGGTNACICIKEYINK